MKKVVFLMAVALLLLTASWQPAKAVANPWDYSSVYTDGGEDHPWGGEQNNDAGAGIRTTHTNDVNTLTGISSIDMYLFKIWTSWFMPSNDASTTHSTIWWIVPTSSTTVTSDKPTDPTTTTTTTTTTTSTGTSGNN